MKRCRNRNNVYVEGPSNTTSYSNRQVNIEFVIRVLVGLVLSILKYGILWEVYMMSKYEQKTKETDKDVIEFIETVESLKKRQDAYKLLEIFSETSDFEPKMWGPSIIGFGSYHYKYATGHEGDAPFVGFSPRKAKISLYFATGDTEREELLQRFGKHTTGKACVYINKVDDIDVEVLKELILQSIGFLKNLYPENK